MWITARKTGNYLWISYLCIIMEYQKTVKANDDKWWHVRSKALAMRAKSYGAKISKFSWSSPQNNSETIRNAYDKEIPEERYISPEETSDI